MFSFNTTVTLASPWISNNLTNVSLSFANCIRCTGFIRNEHFMTSTRNFFSAIIQGVKKTTDSCSPEISYLTCLQDAFRIFLLPMNIRLFVNFSCGMLHELKRHTPFKIYAKLLSLAKRYLHEICEFLRISVCNGNESPRSFKRILNLPN